MSATLWKVDEAMATMAALPVCALSHFLHSLEFPVFGTVDANRVCALFAHATGACQAILAFDIKRMFVVDDLVWVDERAAFAVRAVYPRVFRRAEVRHSFEKGLLCVAIQSVLEDTTGERLGAASRRHAGLVVAGLADDVSQTL